MEELTKSSPKTIDMFFEQQTNELNVTEQDEIDLSPGEIYVSMLERKVIEVGTENESLQKVADKLHNTKAVCKSNYIDPYLIQTYLNDTKRFNATFKNAFTKEEITDKYIELLKLNH